LSATDDFQQIVKQVETARHHYLAGDPAPFKALWSHADDVTLLGGVGAYAKGWEQVGPRLDEVAARFHEGRGWSIEPLAMGMSGDLAYTVHLERSEVRVADRDEWSPVGLRVTHLYRREEGTWKIIHRHADASMERIEVTAALQQ
jgi:ketosteroid isomerase-like protein